MTTPTTPDRQDVQRKPLTDDEILMMWMRKNTLEGAKNIIEFARAIERAHGIGE